MAAQLSTYRVHLLAPVAAYGEHTIPCLQCGTSSEPGSSWWTPASILDSRMSHPRRHGHRSSLEKGEAEGFEGA